MEFICDMEKPALENVVTPGTQFTRVNEIMLPKITTI